MGDHESEAYVRNWEDLFNVPETGTQVKDRLHIYVDQCLHMQSEILKLLRVLRQDQSPAAREFFGIATRALKLVEECSTERWLLKAVEIGDCPEHFVELYLDLRWLSTVLCLTGQEMISISEVYKVRGEDKRSLMCKVNEVLEGHDNRRRCRVEQQLAAILRDRNEICSISQPSPPPDLKTYVRRFRFDIVNKLFFQRVKGGSSFIVKCRWVYNKEFALKMALKSCGELDVNIIKREAQLMEKCRHPYVVGVVGCWEVKASKSFMVMECMKCTLKELIDRRRRITATKQGFSASEAIDLLLPIAKALRYMHGKVEPIAHRDIKPDNIMCSREAEVDTKLIDFEHSMEFDPRCFSRKGVALSEHTFGVAGTTGYMAPEVRDCKPGVFCDLLKADVFSFGMVLGELLTWKTPEEALCAQPRGMLMSRSALIALLERGWRPQLPYDIPVYVAFIVESCWRKSPSARPSFEDICLMLQNAQHLLSLNVTDANEATSSLVSYTDSIGAEWPIEGKFTLREMLNLEEEMDSEGLLVEFTRIECIALT